MKSNLFKWLIRAWIALVSVVAMIAGWAFFGHSAGPVTAGTTTNTNQTELEALPTLAPLPSSNSSRSGSNIQPFTQRSVPQLSQPTFRSRGS